MKRLAPPRQQAEGAAHAWIKDLLHRGRANRVTHRLIGRTHIGTMSRTWHSPEALCSPPGIKPGVECGGERDDAAGRRRLEVAGTAARPHSQPVRARGLPRGSEWRRGAVSR